MKEFNKIEKVEQKPAYEPVEMQVNVITPMGVLCQSGGGGGFSMKALGKGGAI